MSFYRQCSLCGSNLDPGERCDCEQEAQREESERQKMVFVGKNGQITFAMKEAKVLENAVG